jgi:hypothetical protein
MDVRYGLCSEAEDHYNDVTVIGRHYFVVAVRNASQQLEHYITCGN